MKSHTVAYLSLWASAGVALIASGCHKGNDSLADGGITKTNLPLATLVVPVLTENHAIQIAKLELTQRGTTNYSINSCRLSGKEWVVFVDFSATVFGAHAMIRIPTNGLAVRYVPGR